MATTREVGGAVSEQPTFNICLLNPALLPEWFWLPVREELDAQGHNALIPKLPRSDLQATCEDDVAEIIATMDDLDNQYLVSLSRGVESGVRYVQHLIETKRIHKLLGWMIISSAGPRGYQMELGTPEQHNRRRHSEGWREAINKDQDGYEVIEPDDAYTYLLHDITDTWLRRYTYTQLVRQRPHKQSDIDTVPRLVKGIIPIESVIGVQDKVDNQEQAAEVSRREYGVEPIFMPDWGHIAPLTHTLGTTKVILDAAYRAYILRAGGSLNV